MGYFDTADIPEEPVLSEEKIEEEFRADGRFGEVLELLKKSEIPFYDYEVTDYIRMFDCIGELTLGALSTEEMVEVFAALTGVMADEKRITGRDKMRAMCKMMDEMPVSAGKLDRKAKLFFGFCVYAACNIISENDDKKHYYRGLPEFESAEYIKYKMEEYWVIDPYMFTFHQ